MELRKKVSGVQASTALLLISAAVLSIFSLYMWQKYVIMSDRRVVWSAVENALGADGVQFVVDDSTDGVVQRATTTLDFIGDLGSEVRSEFKDDSIDSVIRTVSTKTEDFLYYERNDNTKTPQLKELEGVWVDIGTEGQTESKTLADTFTNGSLVLAGNLSGSDRKKLIKQMQADKLYVVQGITKSERIDGKEFRTYKVKLSSTAYNKALKSYFSAIGLDEASSQVQLDGSPDLNPIIEIAIDMKSRAIVGTGYPDIASTGARVYSQWDKKYTFDLPMTTISGEELQKRTESIYTQTE